jgi:hypothetical protein
LLPKHDVRGIHRGQRKRERERERERESESESETERAILGTFHNRQIAVRLRS